MFVAGFRDAAIVVLSEANKALHVDEITKRAIADGHVKTHSKIPRKTMWRAIDDDIKKLARESKFVKAGPSTYRLRSPDSTTTYRGDQSPDPEETEMTEHGILSQNTQKDETYTQKLAAAGEHRVLSELLLRGYDANKPTIDDGVDVWATKDGRQFYIQVKTATGKSDKYISTIRKKSFSKKRNLQMYYVFVLRDDNTLDFVVLSSRELSKMVGTKKEHTTNYTVYLSKKGDKVFLNKHDVTQYKNDWNL